LVQVAVPSRGDVGEYQRLKKNVHEIVGDICGRHSSLGSQPPVVYLDQSIDHDQLTALYRVADVCLITSIRDGMNLVSYEFVACQEGKHGVLILSEFAGAAQSLGAGSIRVNPWNLRETADAILQALTMDLEEKIARHEYAWQIIHKHTAQKWAETFIQTLKEACVESEEIVTRVPPLLPYEVFLDEFCPLPGGQSGNNSPLQKPIAPPPQKNRLLLIDLLDCLVPSKVKKNLPIKLYQSLLIIPQQVLQCLAVLAREPNTTLVIVTMHQRSVLERLFGHLRGSVILAAENGCIYRGLPRGDQIPEWKSVVEEETLVNCEDWMLPVQEVFNYFRERTPGSYTERQEYSLQWYYDNTQSDFGNQQARELLIYLWAGPLVNSEAEVVLGNRAITVRPHGCSRGNNIVKILSNELGQEQIEKIDWAACFAEVSVRDDGVFDALEELLTLSGGDLSEDDAVTMIMNEHGTVGGSEFPPDLNLNLNEGGQAQGQISLNSEGGTAVQNNGQVCVGKGVVQHVTVTDHLQGMTSDSSSCNSPISDVLSTSNMSGPSPGHSPTNQIQNSNVMLAANHVLHRISECQLDAEISADNSQVFLFPNGINAEDLVLPEYDQTQCSSSHQNFEIQDGNKVSGSSGENADPASDKKEEKDSSDSDIRTPPNDSMPEIGEKEQPPAFESDCNGSNSPCGLNYNSSEGGFNSPHYGSQHGKDSYHGDRHADYTTSNLGNSQRSSNVCLTNSPPDAQQQHYHHSPSVSPKRNLKSPNYSHSPHHSPNILRTTRDRSMSNVTASSGGHAGGVHGGHGIDRHNNKSFQSGQSETTDEAGRISYFSVSLGRRMSRAKYSLPNPYHMQNLLKSMVERLQAAGGGLGAGEKVGKEEGEAERSRAVLVGPEAS